MIHKLKNYVKKHEALFVFAKAIKHPWVTIAGWFYGAYLTLRYVDERTSFPAIYFDGGLIRMKISKGSGSKLILRGNLIIAPFLGGEAPSSLYLGWGAVCCIEGDFVIGDDVRLMVSENAILHVGGKKESSGSGITCQSKILVKHSVKICADTIISWGVFITDSDHHPIHGVLPFIDVVIGEHVWLGTNVQVLKGSVIGSNSMVGSQTVVLQGEYPEKSLLTGNPAKIKCKAPDWSRD